MQVVQFTSHHSLQSDHAVHFKGNVWYRRPASGGNWWWSNCILLLLSVNGENDSVRKTLYNNSFYNAVTFSNFPTGNQMDHNFANMRVLMQVSERKSENVRYICRNLSFLGFGWKPLRQHPAEWRLFSFLFLLSLVSRKKHVHVSLFFIFQSILIYVIAISSLDRFLLDFKREFSYPRVYRVWETIWAAGKRYISSLFIQDFYNFMYSGQISTPQFYLFIALSLVETYRDIIIDRWDWDYTINYN